MKKKTLVIAIITAIISLFSISYTFAANDEMGSMMNGVRNVVGGAENAIEGAGSAVGRTVQNGMDTIGNGAKDVGNATGNVMQGATENNNGYTATRTSTRGVDTTNNSALGVSNTTQFLYRFRPSINLTKCIIFQKL